MSLANTETMRPRLRVESGGRTPSAFQRMFAGKLTAPDRGLVALAGAAVLLALVLPIWWIYLWAPQYPGGLNVLVHARELHGDIQNVNILNHYIGMRPVSPEMFPELTWMTPVLASLGGLLLLVALIGRAELLIPGFLAVFAFDAFMLYDLGNTLYLWGHDLDPRAPMNVAPFMPPVLGYKQIANFVVYSIPSWGGALVMLATALGLLVPFLRWRRTAKAISR